MRIVIAMSGGVDSSVAAALLKADTNFDVIGISMQIWDDYSTPCEKSCCSSLHFDDARAVAEQLKIPHYTIDFRQDFEKKVVSSFCDEYFRGRTPSPCIICNNEIKFKTLRKKAQSLGAEFIATGHYATIGNCSEKGQPFLKRGRDPEKDQSYFLFGLTRDILTKTVFPLGRYKKTQVRQLAERFSLSVARKKESQEICFIPGGNYREFLSLRYPQKIKSGFFVDKKGEILGKHQGIAFYTIGQRRGLGVCGKTPYYVIKIDPFTNTVVLGGKEDLLATRLIASGGNLDNLFKGQEMLAQIRYRHQPAKAKVLDLFDNKVTVEFKEPQLSVTPGQAVVFYKNESVLGGSWIDKTF